LAPELHHAPARNDLAGGDLALATVAGTAVASQARPTGQEHHGYPGNTPISQQRHGAAGGPCSTATPLAKLGRGSARPFRPPRPRNDAAKNS